jgi:Tfp pilus assembly protein PilO
MTRQVFDDDLRRFGRLLHYGGLLVTVVFATTAYSLLHAPTVHAITETATRIEEIKLSAQNAPIIRDHHQRVANKLAEVERRIAAVQGRVPKEHNADEFLKDVSRIAAEEQLAITDFQPQKPTSKSGYAEMEIMLKGQGSFASICRFLDQLARLSRLSKVKALTMSAADDANQYPMTATLIIYFGIDGSSGARPKEVGRG